MATLIARIHQRSPTVVSEEAANCESMRVFVLGDTVTWIVADYVTEHDVPLS